MSSLYELSNAYKRLRDMEEEIDGETLHEKTYLDTLESIEEPLKDKANNIAKLIKKLTSDVAEKKEKIAVWQRSKKIDEKKLEWLKFYLTQELDHAGIKKLETEDFILSPRYFKASTVVYSLDLLPDKFKNTKVEVTPDKSEIYKAIKAGDDVPGAHLEPNRNVVIK